MNRLFLTTMHGVLTLAPLLLTLLPTAADALRPVEADSVCCYDGYRLVWSDEFDTDGSPSAVWSYQHGFQRNQELQWYQPQNAVVRDGCLVIEGRRETVQNPLFSADSPDWRQNRPQADYTSACLTTQHSFCFQFGRVEVRAKIPTARGAWPAIWLLGNQWEWPANGEIDVMEFYLKNDQPSILANTCWGGAERWQPVWNESVTPLTHFTERDSCWTQRFHVWWMDWNRESIRIFLDGELLGETDLRLTRNQGYGGNSENPFNTTEAGFGHYLLLNLAIGSNGGVPDDAAFPLRYYIDYVRVYQRVDD